VRYTLATSLSIDPGGRDVEDRRHLVGGQQTVLALSAHLGCSCSRHADTEREPRDSASGFANGLRRDPSCGPATVPKIEAGAPKALARSVLLSDR
jgi:hypothetical protein